MSQTKAKKPATAVVVTEQTTVATIESTQVPRPDVQFTLGREAVRTAAQSFEAGVRFETAKTRLEQARSRLSQITAELRELANSVVTANHAIDIDLAVLHIQAVRPEIEMILSAVNPQLAETAGGQAQIEKMAHDLVQSFISQIEAKK